jgi:23S rRNA (cytosine1962-C5)-methyltransferase
MIIKTLSKIIYINYDVSNMSNKFRLVDCGDRKKLEYLGEIKVIRPCPQAIWPKKLDKEWETDIDVEFIRTGEERGVWHWNETKYFYDEELENAYYDNKKEEKNNLRKFTKAGTNPSKIPVPKNWTIQNEKGLKWLIEPNEFGNVGVFVEHWSYLDEIQNKLKEKSNILNLFTYSGSNCVELVKKGHKVVAVDSSRNAMNTFTSNLDLNKISREGQKLVLEDCLKFMAREVRRGTKYDCIMIDAPSFGRGTKGEVFKIEDDFTKLLTTSGELLENDGFIVCTSHSPRYTPKILEILASQLFPNKKVTSTEIFVPSESGLGIPSGFLLIIG